MTVEEIRKRLSALADKEKARVLQGFFKTGPGQYGEGDLFLGITVPVLRRMVKECKATSVPDAFRLLRSAVHEERLFSLFLLIQRYGKGDMQLKQRIYHRYLKNAAYVNNWDLVDLSAPNIAGDFLVSRSRKHLYTLARSSSLWERRIAILATLCFIRRNDFSDTLRIAKILLADEHDLIQKAVGWMLREVGKRDQSVEEDFLRRYYKKMPRTMLRYAIERFPEDRRKRYLDGTI